MGNRSASGSVLHAFATFIMLSSSSLIYSAYALVSQCETKYINGTLYKTVLICDPTIAVYSTEYISYLVVAVILFSFLTLFPALLLCLYPTRIYETLSQCWGPRKRIAMQTFAEALHSCFKNGLNGTRDYRALAGFVLLLPFLFESARLTVIFVIQSNSVIIMGFLCFLVSLSVSYFRPCKTKIMNLSFSFHCLLHGMLAVDKGLWDEDFLFSAKTLAVMFVVLPAISHILILIWAGYKSTSCVKYCYRCLLRSTVAVFKGEALPCLRKNEYEELQ